MLAKPNEGTLPILEAMVYPRALALNSDADRVGAWLANRALSNVQPVKMKQHPYVLPK